MKLAREILPCGFTVGSLFAGFLSIVYSINGLSGDLAPNPVVAAWLVILAGLLDLLDGKVARFSRSASRFGVELDSLADLVSFGVAPAVLLYTLRPFGWWSWLPGAIFITCGAIRLARFNIQLKSFEKENFSGLPIPLAAGTVVCYVIFSFHLWDQLNFAGPLLALIGLAAGLMVSKVEYKSFSRLASDSFGSPIKMGLFWGSALALILYPELMGFPLAIVYVFGGLGMGVIHALREEEVANIP